MILLPRRDDVFPRTRAATDGVAMKSPAEIRSAQVLNAIRAQSPEKTDAEIYRDLTEGDDVDIGPALLAWSRGDGPCPLGPLDDE